MTANNEHRPVKKYIWLFFALFVVAVYFLGLNIPLLGPDEPRYSQVAREMFERGDWITPTLGGFNWFEKPALLYWLQIAAYNIFGVSEFAARFGSALFGLGTIASIWMLGRAVERRLPADYANCNFANWLALIAASTIGIIAFSRAASFDIILTFPVTASLAGFFIWELGGQTETSVSDRKDGPAISPSPRLPFSLSLPAFYFFIGVALIAKGLVGIVFPMAIVAFYYLLSRKFPPRAFIISLIWGTVLALAAASAWYLPMYQRNGWTFIDEFFIQHHFQRYTSNKYLHPQPFYFFFWVLPLMTIPWLPFFIGSLWNFIPRKANTVESGMKEGEAQTVSPSPPLLVSSSPLLHLRRFALAWLLVPLVFFTFSGSKLPGYILPALPAAVILAGEYAWRFTRKNKLRRVLVQMTATGTLAVVIVLGLFFVKTFAEHESVKTLIQAADSEGHANERVLNLFGMSHNSEFYAPGRLVRTTDGKQKMFFSVREMVDEMAAKNEKSALVLVPLRHLEILTKSDLVEIKMLADNTEFAIAAIRKK
jgi:4-amino-4-deoxy-L-arabinose transferase-like glycosyltransferase